MPDYEAIIGLEVHCQLATQTKIFAPDPVAFGAPPNSLISEVTLGLPGVLPVLNRRAVDGALKAGLALGCEIHLWSQFARKNYFYPDLPKGYQISQFEHPICGRGELEFEVDKKRKRCGITRIHLEEDAGKSVHDSGPYTLLDFNRAGTALIEIVSEPDLRSAEEAAAYLRALHEIVVALGICDGNMEEGSFRCDANVSIRLRGDTQLNTRTELKNLNSFKFIEAAINHEIKRQTQLVAEGGAVVQQTRLWDEKAATSRVMRTKEQADDYRYFPDPDLPPLILDPTHVEHLRHTLPELPAAKRARYQSELALPEYDARVLTRSTALSSLFEDPIQAGAAPKAASNLIMTEVLRLLAERNLTLPVPPLSAATLAEIIALMEQGEITRNTTRTVLERALDSARTPRQIVQEDGLAAVSDDNALGTLIDEILTRESAQVERYRKGAKKLFGFFMGQVMRSLKGQADPKALQALLRQKLDS